MVRRRPGHEPTWTRQLALVEQRQTDAAPDPLLLVEHPHVYTLGRKREAEANAPAAGDVEVIGIERGGDVTYHGRGQIVAYPIVLLQDDERDLHRYHWGTLHAPSSSSPHVVAGNATNWG